MAFMGLEKASPENMWYRWDLLKTAQSFYCVSRACVKGSQA